MGHVLFLISRITAITYSKVFFFISATTYLLFLCLFPGHIHQVKENLSKPPQELIPAVFANT